MSWGSRTFFAWTLGGRLLRRASNRSHYVDFQDCQHVGDRQMLCSGIADLGDPADTHAPPVTLGGLELVALDSFAAVRQLPVHAVVGPENARVPLTRNAMFVEVRQGGLLFHWLPEDGAGTIYQYRWTPKR